MYIISIDQGTTGTTVGVVDLQGNLIVKHNHEIRQHYPKPGWVEHDLDDIWHSVVLGIRRVMDKAKLKAKDIKAIGITNQRETVGLWERQSGKPLARAIVWQCRRTSEECRKLKNKGLEKTVQKKTGLLLDPYFSATKISWLLKNIPSAKVQLKKNNLAAGTIDSFLIFRLTNGQSHKTDVSNASRTSLMNLKTTKWDSELLDLFGVPNGILPEICDSVHLFGETSGIPGLLDGTPIYGVAGDQQSALFGQMAFSEGDAKCTYGTGSFMLMNTGSKPVFSKAGLLTTVAWRLPGQKTVYALEGSAFVAGATIQWLRDGLQFIRNSHEVEALARQVNDTGGVQLVPAFAGLGAPYWDPDARAVICGLTRGSGKSHIARAALEGIALQNVDILRAMEKDLGKNLRSLKVDGGASANNLLMQMQSDFMGVKVIRPQNLETTCMGAAYLAGLGAGLWSSLKSLNHVSKIDAKFGPQISRSMRAERLRLWHSAVHKSSSS